MLAQIQFQQYHVTKVDFKYNPFYEGEDSLIPYFDYTVEPRTEGHLWVTLNLTVGDASLKDSSIFVSASLAGLFELLSDETDDSGLSNDVTRYKANFIAILYPYLRSLVSDITSKGTLSPLILPTMNVVAYIDAQEKSRSELTKNGQND